MKTAKLFVFCLTIFCASPFVRAQAFTDLNFESATMVPASGFYVQFNQAFPGWTGTVDGVQQALVLSNEVYLDSAGISIIDNNWTNSTAHLSGFPGGVIQGNYTAILMSGNTLGANPQPADTTLSQTSLVPIGIQSLQFEAYQVFDSLGAFTVTLDGQNLSLIVISNTLNYTLYSANISAWAGQTAQLSFNVLGENPHVDDEYLYLDSIQFSTQSVPEPGELDLVALGTLFLGFRRR